VNNEYNCYSAGGRKGNTLERSLSESNNNVVAQEECFLLKLEYSLPCSQKPTTLLHSVPDVSSERCHVPFL
jgi:hypothetical protein